MIAPRSTIPHFPSSAGPCATGFAAPEEGSSSRPTSGAARFFTDEGDLVAVPPFERVAGNRFTNCAGRAVVARRSHKPEVASSNLAPATSSVSARTRVAGREGEASGSLPPPQGPP